MTNKLNKIQKVNETFTINRYDNGFMVEVAGKDNDSNWKTSKVLCNTEDEMVEVVKEWNTMEVDD